MKKQRVPILSFLILSFIYFLTGAIAYGAGRDNGTTKPTVADLTIEQLMEIEVASVYGASKFDQKVNYYRL